MLTELKKELDQRRHDVRRYERELNQKSLDVEAVSTTNIHIVSCFILHTLVFIYFKADFTCSSQPNGCKVSLKYV